MVATVPLVKQLLPEQAELFGQVQRDIVTGLMLSMDSSAGCLVEYRT